MSFKTEKKVLSEVEKKILEIATELFALNGFEGTSIRDICKAADVNVSAISYYFGGKKELYERVVDRITGSIIAYMKDSLGFDEMPTSFDHLSKQEKTEFFFKALNFIVDYFYSDRISDSSIMIFFREQITSGVPLNAMGYKIFRKLLASILGKDENDKEVIFRCITIIGQVHAARVFKQFSLNMMNQESYSKDDINLFKKVIMNQAESILKGLGVYDG